MAQEILSNNPVGQEVMKEMEILDQIQKDINVQSEVLKANKIGMSDPLVDDEGFPRNDIDVYQVRIARHKIICLQNDLKIQMNKVHRGIEAVHGIMKDLPLGGNGTDSPILAQRNIDNTKSPQSFLKVNLVSAGSPSATAGILVDDEIMEFGTVNYYNFTAISQIGEIVLNRKDSPLNVKINRSGKILNLTLTPKVWSGKGLLGCNVVPFESVDR